MIERAAAGGVGGSRHQREPSEEERWAEAGGDGAADSQREVLKSK